MYRWVARSGKARGENGRRENVEKVCWSREKEVKEKEVVTVILMVREHTSVVDTKMVEIDCHWSHSPHAKQHNM